MKTGLSVCCVLVPGVMLVTAVYASEMRIEGGALQLNGGTVQNCSIIRGTGTANSVYTIAGGKWMSEQPGKAVAIKTSEGLHVQLDDEYCSR